MKPSKLIRAINLCLDAKQPVCLWGAPGVGKSDIIFQVGQMRGIPVSDQRLVTLDPVDLRGLPTVQDGLTKFTRPEFLPRDGKGILFLDEMNRAPQMVQNAALQLVLCGRIGEHVLPPDWLIVAACNPTGAGVTKMSDALYKRFSHLKIETDLDDWCKWACANQIEPAVIAFLRFRPELLLTEHACPRTWAFVSKITAQQPDKEIELELFSGTVGEGEAIEYAAFLQLYRNIPSIDSILLAPDKAPVPVRDAASLWAISSALARRATDTNLRRIIKYLDRMPGEYSAMAMRDVAARDGSLMTADGATEWIVAHPEVFA